MSHPASASRLGATDLNDVSIPTSSLEGPASTSYVDPSSRAATAVDATVQASSSHPASQHASAPTVMPSTVDPIVSPEQQLPSTDDATSGQPTAEGNTAGPVLSVTLLMTSGGRYPLRISQNYLRKRNISATDDDPYNLSVYTLKELIWREWKDEWDSRPSSQGSIRLIHFGRLLDDKSILKDCRFNAEAPNVIHMTVRPQEIVDEEDAKAAKKLGHDAEGSQPSPACRCNIL